MCLAKAKTDEIQIQPTEKGGERNKPQMAACHSPGHGKSDAELPRTILSQGSQEQEQDNCTKTAKTQS
jgi:hypothetical protein